jgi:PAS domain S-box-containing protein
MSELQKNSEEKFFNLTRYFSITSAIAIAIVTCILSVAYYVNSKHEIVESLERENIFITQNIGNTFWPHFADYVINAKLEDAAYLRNNYQTTEINELIKIAVKDLPILKVKIYNLDGLTVFSSHFNQIGEVKKNNKALYLAAKNGATTTKLTEKDSFTGFSGEYGHRDIIESYIPIGRTPGLTEAVFEVYFDATDLMHKLIDKSLLIALGLFLTFGSLYAVLMAIVKRAETIMVDQYSSLGRKQISIRLKNKLLEQGIKDRELAEKNAYEGAQRFKTLFDDSNEAILVIDPTKEKIIDCNNKAVNLLGYAREDYSATTLSDIYPSHVKEARHFIQQIRAEGSGQTSELPCMTKSGWLMPAEISAGMIELDNKPAVLMHINDLSQRIKAENDLRTSEARFRGAIESMEEGFALFDADDRLVVYNNKFTELHEEIKDIIAPGVTHEKILRTFVSRGIFPEAKGSEEEFIRMRLELRKQKRFGSAIRNLANGKSFIIRENYMDDGGVFITFSDITQIQQANRRFRKLIESSPDATVLIGDKGGVSFANERFEKIFGYKHDEIVGYKIEKFIPEDFLSGHDWLSGSCEPAEEINVETTEREVVGLTKDGRQIPLEITLNPTETDQGPLVIGAIRDISKRKVAESALRESEARFRSFVENLPFAISIKETDNKYKIVNKTYEKWYGVKHDAVFGKTPDQVFKN